MTNSVYGRRYSLVIGRPQRIDYTNPKHPSAVSKPITNGEYQEVTFSREINNTNVPAAFGVDRGVIPAEYKEWTTTQFTAEVDSTKEGSKDNNTNTTIKLWNLSKEEQLSIKKGYNVVLRAGYNQDTAGGEPPPGIEATDFQAELKTLEGKDLPLIFTGEITKVRTVKEGENTITSILCSDGGFAFKGVRLSKTYAGPNTYRDIIEDIIKSGTIFGIRFGEIFYNEMAESIAIDMTVHGYLLDELNKVCDSIGHKAYFCLGKVYVEPKYQTTARPVVSLRNEEELYYIRWEDSFDGYSEGSDKDSNSVELSTPLDGRLNVISLLRIEEGDYSGEREITSLKHKMDYEGSDWDTILVAKSR